MSVSSQRGHIAWAIQQAKFGSASAVAATGFSTTGWHRHRAESVSLGVNDLYDVLPLEVGGSLFVNSSDKNGAFVAGGARLFSRLQGSIGYLLHGVGGLIETQITGNSTTAYKTRFSVDPTDETIMPWIAMRKYTPSSNATGATEYFLDCRVNMLTISVPAMGPVMMEFMVVGRKPELDDGETSTAANVAADVAFESGVGLSHGCKGTIALSAFTGGGLPFATSADGKFTSAQIMIANNISQPDQQMVIGSYHPDDLVPLSRSVQVKLIYKWEDPKLYKKLYYNGGTGANIQWSPIVGTSPVEISSTSVANISGLIATPYSFKFYAGDVDWTMTPPQLAGNNLLFCEFTGIVKGGNSADPAWYIDLVNSTSYSDLLAL